LREEIHTHPGQCENAFFHSVPQIENNLGVLRAQQLQIDTMLAISLQYGNVLYCMDNETNDAPEWGSYWAKYLQAAAAKADTRVECTEMWDDWDLLGAEHAATIDQPELYSFVDISQNNHQPPDHHWANPQEVRKKIAASGHIRPMNSVKIYGANSGEYGSTRDAQERFWRNIFGGLASSRFHRPPTGLGLSEIAQTHIRSMRLLTDQMDIFVAEPHNDLLQNRSWNEAYCAAVPGAEYAIFFPDGGDVLLDVSAYNGESVSVRWIDIRRSSWMGEATAVTKHNQRVRLVTPAEEGYWAVLVRPAGTP
jgi:hypothetical protein